MKCCDRKDFIKMAVCGMASIPMASHGERKAGVEGFGTLRIAHLCDPQFGFTSGRPAMKHRSSERYVENYRADIARCERAIAIVNELKPDLLLFGGDMAQHAKDIPLEWPRLLRLVKVPWMVTPGNHDFEYHPGRGPDRVGLERFNGVFGRDHEVRDVKGWRIVAGNSQFWFPSEAKDEQTEYERWVGTELEKARTCDGRVILASHIPPFAHDPEETDSYENCPCVLRAKRLEAYIASGARFYLAAHQHRLAVRGYRNLTILTGEAMCANFDMRPTGFRLFEVKDDFSYSWNFVAVE